MENQEEIEYIHLERDINICGKDPERVKDNPFYKAYLESLIASEGFNVNDEILKEDEEDYMGIIISISDRDLVCECLVEPAKTAVEEFNRLKGTDLVFRRVVRACTTFTNGFIAYLTLECTNGRFYEAKIFEPMGGRPVELCIFRPAKHYHPSPSKRENAEDGSVSLGCNNDKSKIGDTSPSDKSDNSKESEFICSNKSQDYDIEILIE